MENKDENGQELFKGLKEIGYNSDEIAKLVSCVVSENITDHIEDCAHWLAMVAEVSMLYGLIQGVLEDRFIIRRNRETDGWEVKPAHSQEDIKPSTTIN